MQSALAILIGVASLGQAGQYQGPLTGRVNSGNHDFRYGSDWVGGEVMNYVHNLHDVDPLPVSWREGYIYRMRNTLKPKERHFVAFWCESVARKPGTIVYGVQSNKIPASAYDCAAKKVPQVLTSRIFFGIGENRWSLNVISTHVDGRVVYSFVQRHRVLGGQEAMKEPLGLSFTVAPAFGDRLAKSFEVQGWKVASLDRKMEGFGEFVERNRDQEDPWDKDDFEAFLTFQAPDLRSAVMVELEPGPVMTQPRLVLVSDPSKHALLGTGVLSLHESAGK